MRNTLCADLWDRFGEFGEIKQMQLPLDRRTGFVKGYALIEYEKKQEAQKAIEGENGKDFMECTITVEWAFSKSLPFFPASLCFSPLPSPPPCRCFLYHSFMRLSLAPARNLTTAINCGF